MSDGTILVWGLRPPEWQPPKEKLSVRQIEALWEDLSGKAPQAYRAALTLSTDERAVAFLEKRLRRVATVKPADIQQWINDLDDDSFEKRQAAQTALANAGQQAESALRKAMEGKPSVEATVRLKRLIQPLDSCFITKPDTLREVRAIGVLARINTPAARVLLKEIAKGAPEAIQTRTAAVALRALKPVEK